MARRYRLIVRGAEKASDPIDSSPSVVYLKHFYGGEESDDAIKQGLLDQPSDY
jgi:hypothetical protein